MTWTDITNKFLQQAESVIGNKAAQEVVNRAAEIEKEADVRAFAELLGGRA
jgi:hypothetical protein